MDVKTLGQWLAKSLCFLGLFYMPTNNSANAQFVPSEKLLEMERSLIESRHSIRSGIIRISTKRPVDEIPQLRGLEKSYVNHFDEETLRWDTYYAGSRHTYVYGSAGSIEGDHSRIDPFLVFGPTTKAKRPIGGPDALRLGLICWYFPSLSEFGYDRHFLRGDRKAMVGKVETLDGLEVLKAEYDYTEMGGVDAHAQYELLVQSDYMPRYIRLSWTIDETTTETELLSKWKKYDGDVWYPTETIYRSSDNGTVKNEEITTVESAQFNIPIPHIEFELAGIGLKTGRAVDVDSKIFYWTGKNLTRTPILADDAVRPLRRRIYLFAAILMSAMIVALVLRGVRPDRPTVA